MEKEHLVAGSKFTHRFCLGSELSRRKGRLRSLSPVL